MHVARYYPHAVSQGPLGHFTVPQALGQGLKVHASKAIIEIKPYNLPNLSP
ncbi:uncharacterized protein PHALS_09947 [Plasmopara halstedii]|uniref:Uncharacterized protein n=1 Tax=Plasmopara halstedii TaxID=4781 RepID=A0A0P1AGD1_PLAHL|nr:uncharacterized protein PHALS_09947 [Plasmopara halstedii]CEG39711.1 hypothetical protein PHALS_09947 [Plasmopara halstedii]|eukprot:XP_024576080.1 hypothetical protein PHALS_09947 [Plasmopara halstedii]